MHEPRLRIVEREDAVHVGRPLERKPLSAHHADCPALAVAVRACRGDLRADQVAICDSGDVRSACAHQGVPLPQSRVYLDELQPTVPRVPLPFDLCDPVEPEFPQKAQTRIDDLVVPDRLADSRTPHVLRRSFLPENSATGLPSAAT